MKGGNIMEENKNTKCKKCNANFWKALAMLMLGIVIGFVFAPIKKGVYIGSYNSAEDCMNGNKANDCKIGDKSTDDLPDCDEITAEDAKDDDSSDDEE